MEIKLSGKPRRPTIICGYPGFGMVGMIATEFLIEHLRTESIGKIVMPELPALVAIHEGKLIEPFGVFYNKKYNLIVIHAIGSGRGTEWLLSNAILTVARSLKAKEIISLEGVSSGESEEQKSYYYSTGAKASKSLSKAGVAPLTEGIILGVTSALLLKSEIPVTCIFSATSAELPDSKAAAKVVETLDNYLGLDVDYKPLLTMAAKFEDKLKKIMQQKKVIEAERDKKEMSYLG